jgi:hypothetical protein
VCRLRRRRGGARESLGALALLGLLFYTIGFYRCYYDYYGCCCRSPSSDGGYVHICFNNMFITPLKSTRYGMIDETVCRLGLVFFFFFYLLCIFLFLFFFVHNLTRDLRYLLERFRFVYGKRSGTETGEIKNAPAVLLLCRVRNTMRARTMVQCVPLSRSVALRTRNSRGRDVFSLSSCRPRPRANAIEWGKKKKMQPDEKHRENVTRRREKHAPITQR